MFVTDNDYEVQVRQEIVSLLDGSNDHAAMRLSERMAVDQIKSYLSGRYDTATIFAQEGDDRDHFLVMITIDLALYHLWSKRAPRKIPEFRAQRYQDALDWLKAVGEGTLTTDLPQLATEDYTGDVVIKSNYKPNRNKF
jgi:phage gp36-like protein